MKAVLISIQPKWCELIAKGKKTVEVRKTRPQLATPFKVYIYCTKHPKGLITVNRQNERCNCKVIGEFVCDRIDYTTKDKIKAISEASCLSVPELWDYGRKSSAYDLYGWHITNLVIYEKPKELSEFVLANTKHYCHVQRPPQSWCYVEEVTEK